MMFENLGIRNFVHYKYNLHLPFNLMEYEKYLKDLKQTGITEIEHAGSSITKLRQKERLKNVIDINHDLGLKFIFYTGVFGTENISNNSYLEKFVQRDKKGNLLSYENKGKTTAMMCPASNYVDEITIPYLSNIIQFNNIDGIFIDIPWIMPNGCYCSNCHEKKEKGADNNTIVRTALERIVNSLKEQKPNLSITVNVGAPKIHSENTGAYIDNLTGLFDEYLTEWNPYRWNQNANAIKSSIKYAKEKTGKRVLHATTATNKKGKMYSLEEYQNVFSTIINSGATPRLGVTFPKYQLKIIESAWKFALEKENLNKKL